MNPATNVIERPRNRLAGSAGYYFGTADDFDDVSATQVVKHANGGLSLSRASSTVATPSGQYVFVRAITTDLMKKFQEGAQIILRVFANEGRLSTQAADALEQAVRHGDDWKAVPNAKAQANARRLLSATEAKGLAAVRIARAQDHGIGITFAQRDRRAYVECLNDGTMWASLLGAAPLPTVFELEENGVDFATFTRRIRAHLFPRTL
ncbi:MAG: hypothetical protein IT463_13930 [Planctomycetes bacterium]|nr:hypothetical protein [Planctomycetota bacterium]